MGNLNGGTWGIVDFQSFFSYARNLPTLANPCCFSLFNHFKFPSLFTSHTTMATEAEKELSQSGAGIEPVPVTVPVTDQSDQSPQLPEKNYSDFGSLEKKFIIFMASGAAFFSPLSANIYYPVFNTLAQDLHVSNTLINVTVTAYMVSFARRHLRIVSHSHLY